MMKLITLFSAAFLAACTSTPDTGTEVASNVQNDKQSSDGIVCKLEKTVGSNRKHKVCTTAEERKLMKEAAREGWLRTQSGSSTSGSDL